MYPDTRMPTMRVEIFFNNYKGTQPIENKNVTEASSKRREVNCSYLHLPSILYELTRYTLPGAPAILWTQCCNVLPTRCSLIQCMECLLRPAHTQFAEQHSRNAMPFTSDLHVARWTSFNERNSFLRPADTPFAENYSMNAVRSTPFNERNVFYVLPTHCSLNIIQWTLCLLRPTYTMFAEHHLMNAMPFTTRRHAVRWT